VPEQSGDRRAEVEVRAGFGIVGDRYAGKAAHRDADVESLRGQTFAACGAAAASAARRSPMECSGSAPRC
jgi:hypothetical protein